jgi:hypothetical protein
MIRLHDCLVVIVGQGPRQFLCDNGRLIVIHQYVIIKMGIHLLNFLYMNWVC